MRGSTLAKAGSYYCRGTTPCALFIVRDWALQVLPDQPVLMPLPRFRSLLCLLQFSSPLAILHRPNVPRLLYFFYSTLASFFPSRPHLSPLFFFSYLSNLKSLYFLRSILDLELHRGFLSILLLTPVRLRYTDSFQSFLPPTPANRSISFSHNFPFASFTSSFTSEPLVIMVQSAILGFPRMGVNRDLKKATEACTLCYYHSATAILVTDQA